MNEPQAYSLDLTNPKAVEQELKHLRDQLQESKNREWKTDCENERLSCELENSENDYEFQIECCRKEIEALRAVAEAAEKIADEARKHLKQCGPIPWLRPENHCPDETDPLYQALVAYDKARGGK